MQSAPSGEVTRITLLIIVVGLLIAGSFRTLFPFLGELIWATTIVVATWPILLRLQYALGGRRWAATTILTIIISFLVVAPIFYAIGSVLNALEHGPGVVREFLSEGVGAPPPWVANVPIVGPRLSQRWMELAAGGPEAVQHAVQPYTREAASWVMAATGGFGRTVVHLLLTIILIAILYSTGEIGARGLLAFGYRMGHERGERTIRLAAQAVRSVALGVIFTALVQAVLAGIVLWLTGVPRPGLLAALVFMLGIAQIGPLPIMAIAVIWLYAKDFTTAGTILLVLSIPIIALDNVLRPILIRRGVQLPMLLIIGGVIGGLIAFGVVGLFVGPVILAATYTLTKEWVAEGWPDEKPKHAPVPDAPVPTAPAPPDISLEPRTTPR